MREFAERFLNAGNFLIEGFVFAGLNELMVILVVLCETFCHLKVSINWKQLKLNKSFLARIFDDVSILLWNVKMLWRQMFFTHKMYYSSEIMGWTKLYDKKLF